VWAPEPVWKTLVPFNAQMACPMSTLPSPLRDVKRLVSPFPTSTVDCKTGVYAHLRCSIHCMQ
jgi:hypothetical protein